MTLLRTMEGKDVKIESKKIGEKIGRNCFHKLK